MVGQVSCGFVPFREKRRQKGEKMAHPIGKLILSYLPSDGPTASFGRGELGTPSLFVRKSLFLVTTR
jgi:hypothetical protein